MSDAEIREVLAKQDVEVCGRFYEYQLARKPKSKFSIYRFLSPFFVLIGFSCQSQERESTPIGIIEYPTTNQASSSVPASDSVVPIKGTDINSVIDTNAVYVQVEKMPEFKFGGQQGLSEFLKENVKNPSKGKEGLVVCRFIINREGKITSQKSLKAYQKKLIKKFLGF